jgi:Membrane protein involved in the export of O-antigen and teichoic acid
MFWRGVWGYLPANIIQGVVGFLTIVLFTRLLTPDDFGRYALAYSVFSLMHVATFTWLEAAMARFWAAQATPQDMADHFASIYRGIAVMTLVFIPLAALVIWLWPGAPAIKWALFTGLAGVPIRCVAQTVQEHYRAAGEVKRAAGLSIWTAVAGLIIGVGFALWGAGGSSPLAGLALAPLAALPFILPGDLRQARGGRVQRDRLRRYAQYGYPIAASLALSVLIASTDRMLLALLMNEAAVGTYHAAYSIANRTLDVMFVWLGAAGGPALVMALERGGVEQLKLAAREQASTFLLLGIPAATGVALVAMPLSEVLVGQDLRGAVSQVTPLVALSALLSGMTTYYFHQAYTLGQRTRRLLYAMSIPALSNAALNLWLIPTQGVHGAALATAISMAIGLGASIVVARPVLRMPIPWDALVRCVVAAGAMALVVRTLPRLGGVLELTLDATVGALVYAAVALFLNAAGVRDTALRLYQQFRQRRAEA